MSTFWILLNFFLKNMKEDEKLTVFGGGVGGGGPSRLIPRRLFFSLFCLCSNLPPVIVGLQTKSNQQRNKTMYPDWQRSGTLKQCSQVPMAREPETTLVVDESAELFDGFC